MPFVWSWPGRFGEGVRSNGLASQIDFAPTILDLCGVAIPEGRTPDKVHCAAQRSPWPGRSLRPVLTGECDNVRDWVIVENDEDYLGTVVRTFITDDHKLTVYSGHDDWGELFDRRNDPQELHSLWNAPASQPLKRDLQAQLMRCYLEEESPLPRRMTHA